MYDLQTMIEGLVRLQAKHGPFVFEMDLCYVVGLVKTMQLALQHPGNRGTTAKEMRRFCDNIISTISQEEPEVAEMLRRGYEPDFDDLVPKETSQSDEGKPETDSVGNTLKKCQECGIETYGPLYLRQGKRMCSACDNRLSL